MLKVNNVLNKQQIKILEIVENRYIHENKPYDPKDSYGGYGNRAGNYVTNDVEQNSGNSVQEIVDAVMNNEISYKNFFKYVLDNFQLYGEPKKLEIIEAILHAIDSDEEFKKIKDLT